MKIEFTGHLISDTTKEGAEKEIEEAGVSFAEFETIARVSFQQQLQALMQEKVVISDLHITFDEDAGDDPSPIAGKD